MSIGLIDAPYFSLGRRAAPSYFWQEELLFSYV